METAMSSGDIVNELIGSIILLVSRSDRRQVAHQIRWTTLLPRRLCGGEGSISSEGRKLYMRWSWGCLQSIGMQQPWSGL
jgi:hypothetical protein